MSVLLLVASAEVDEYYHKNCIEFNFDDAEIVQKRHELNIHPISNGAVVETNDEYVHRRQVVVRFFIFVVFFSFVFGQKSSFDTNQMR